MEGRTIGGHALAGNRDESPAVGESPQGLLDVPRAVRGVASALDTARRRRKRRIHDDHGGRRVGGENVIELLRVLAEQRRGRE